MNEVFVSVYIFDGVISEVKAFEKIEDAKAYFDERVYDRCEGRVDLLEDCISDMEYGLFHFLDNDGGRHPVEMLIERVAIEHH